MEYRSEWQSLYEALVEELAVLSRSKKPHLEMVSQAAEVCFLKMEALKATIREYPFVDSCEEIYFFREVKPQFHSSLIYYDKVHLFESERPQGKTSTVEQYISSHEEDIYSSTGSILSSIDTLELDSPIWMKGILPVKDRIIHFLDTDRLIQTEVSQPTRITLYPAF